MTEDTYSKVAQIADELLGKEGMHKYPFLLVIGLLCIAVALRKHRAAEPPTSDVWPPISALRLLLSVRMPSVL